MNKQINFGNSKGLIINDYNVKNKIFDYLFNSLNLSKYRYVMLNNVQRLSFLKKSTLCFSQILKDIIIL